ncbi:MAG: hypothetical protein ACI4WM_07785 [Erysipelotrichaceae bacterium]
MSKQHHIKWRKSDEQELRKAVKNFNAKIARVSKKNPEMKNALPDKVSVKQMKELINTRQDLNRELNALRRFSKRGAEDLVVAPDNDYNLKLTKWQKTEINRRIGVINRRRKKRLEEIQNTEMTSRGESLGYTKGQLGMGKAEEVSLKPMKGFSRTMNRSDLKWKWKTIMAESQSDYFNKRDLMLKENYLKALRQEYNENDIANVIRKIEAMDIKEFLAIFRAEGNDMPSAYRPSDEQYQAYVSALQSIWTPNR